MIAHTTSAKLQEIIKGLRGVYILESLSDSQLNKVAEAVQVCAPQLKRATHPSGSLHLSLTTATPALHLLAVLL